MIDFLSAFGLAGATGLNAYLPLLIVGLLARFTDLVTLASPYNILENPWVLGVLAELLLVEMTVDKIPAADTVNDIIQTVVRPVAGAILFAAFATGGDGAISHISPVLAAICGLLTAGGVHAAKAIFRPAVTATTAGIGNPVVSVAEDVVSGTTTVVAVVLPAVAAAFVLILVAFFVGFYAQRRRRRVEST